MGRRPLLGILALAILAAASLSACGNASDPELSVEAATPGDERVAERIQDELRAYEQSFDLESVPEEQAAQLAPIVDNLPQAAGGVEILRVDGASVEAETGFPADDEGAVTGRLVCGAIVRGAGRDVEARVLGEDGAVLAECKPADANYP